MAVGHLCIKFSIPHDSEVAFGHDKSDDNHDDNYDVEAKKFSFQCTYYNGK